MYTDIQKGMSTCMNIEKLITEKYLDGVIDDDHYYEILEATYDRNEIKRIKEKIKKKEKLTDSEEKLYKEYKKKRNIKIAVGAGVGTLTAATIAKRYKNMKSEDRQINYGMKLADDPRYYDRKRDEHISEIEKERKLRHDNEKNKVSEKQQKINEVIRDYGYRDVESLKKDRDYHHKRYIRLAESLKKAEEAIEDGKKQRNKITQASTNSGLDFDFTLKNFDASTEKIYGIIRDIKNDMDNEKHERDKLNNILDKLGID